jgi:hypothetical protein
MNKIPDNLSRTTCLGALLLGLLLLMSCKPSTPPPDEADPDKPVAGYVTGKVVDTQGRPLERAAIFVDNTLYYNANLLGNTNANGQYRIQTGNGSWQVTAQVKRIYNSKRYELDLEPDNTNAFAGADGAVRNFTWKLSGEKPDNPGAFYGATVDVTSAPGVGPYDIENIDFTFTPVGPLIDGSAGKTLVLQYSYDYNCIPDVPIGRYKITAVYKPTGTRLLVRNRVNGSYSDDGSVTMDFYGAEPYWSQKNCMFLEYRLPE